MSKLTLCVGSKDFDITLDVEFAKFFEKDFQKTFNNKTSIETKELLNAYVQKCYDEYQNQQVFQKLIDKIEKV